MTIVLLPRNQRRANALQQRKKSRDKKA